jgi:hypothetical protein
MKKLLQQLGLIDPEPPKMMVKTHIRTKPPIDMEAFSKWSAELNVSVMARTPEITVRIGNYVKQVTLDRF